jgi:peptidyl-prolyl cis-trans isomerase B (cyclophilin B)
VDNIVRHLGVQFYDGLIFHRVVAGFVIQTGMATPDGMVRTSSAPPVRIEADNGLRNTRGTVGLARMTDPNSGGVQFYINLKDSPELDFTSRTPDGWGYTVFGRVTEGMDVVDRIGRVPTGVFRGAPDTPLQPVIVTRAYVQRPDSAAAPATAAPTR